jgi:hypothetical protein
MKRADSQDAITPFAITDFRDVKRCFGIKEKNRAGHMYILGKTGTGKSTLIQNMVVSDIRRGHGMALIDPHGDLTKAVLNLVPKRRVKDVIYFNPADLDSPIAFNPLERVEPDKSHLITSSLVTVFKKVSGDFWGPRMEHILRNAILALMERPESTLLDIPLLLTDKYFRGNIINTLANPVVQNFWLLEFEKYSPWLRSDATAPILNRIGQFLSSPLIRNIVCQPRSSFNLRQIMDEGKILIVDLSKGKIGDDNCALLGSLLVIKLQLAALSRADIPEEKRRYFHLFIDEIHSFLTMSFIDILSEARKYKLYLVMSHQYIDQLDERVRSAIIGNVGTIISFRVGAEDAKILAKEFHPTFSEADLVNIPNHHIYLKMMIDGHTSNAFSAVTLPPAQTTVSHRKEIIRRTRELYGPKKQDVDQPALSQNPGNELPAGKEQRTLF